MRFCLTMKSSGVGLCVLALGMCQIIIARKVLDCNVTGEWRNELGSRLLLTSVGPEVRGVYRTAVESVRGAAGPNREAKVIGVISDGPQPTIAFSVLWAKGSCASWVGQCFTLPGGDQVLNTLWMLRSAVSSSMNDWDGTRLGDDRFVFLRGAESP
ncbi:Avidin [Bagarius yarrelli]|uniref:Avidin n=1 Tax=Bagarius yarrelli TaxID=175774 RepID=A0A556V5D3_BAGYA|nr:Avidin [Bagarius yarrelli]